MKLNPNVFDLWVYHKAEGVPRYLLLYTSQEKADKWFNGARFWQIPSDFVEEEEEIETALQRVLKKCDLRARSLWAVEHAYTFYNRRFKEIQICTVYAAQVQKPSKPKLTASHSAFGWFPYQECIEKLNFRGLLEGLFWTKKYVTDAEREFTELRLV
ncbi:NUDIX domain-containing protein [candidate division KSB1 bacterium]|nr:NUDIX domain-containing protein [candidate division KSB1 bacterium]NIR69605.1 NUDIX domain-containing protein [candidate division KSB1 bacterium]NIS24322.1 NUDIX domain-containing protein [candidate division KSB1 bacterium]NIT71250.1 NUDIX domain-containing protein [candidate division KSB1 bacterium]NIU24954.1 NUDIX domain-containing protein [candidate division KSB1 bacterium]